MDSPAFQKPFQKPRSVMTRFLVKSQQVGDGTDLRESELSSLDPFLMLFHFSVTKPGGFSDHPHRGCETVTYVIKGSIMCEDFTGHRCVIRTGDVQWMTAGKGIIHAEMPEGEGTHTAIQIWINLPHKDKMIEPQHKDVSSNIIPCAQKDGVEVRVLAGEAMGVSSPVYTKTPTMFLDFTMNPGARLHQKIPDSCNSFVYVIEGEGIFGSLVSSPVTAHHVLVLDHGDGLNAWNKSLNPLRFLLLGGQPLNEPVKQYRTFVMCSQSEIDKTVEDFSQFKNGFEKGKDWRSQ
ncbi:hypothetical protein L6164_013502 [Bauhinia variegata]|uniref:Uncharacterized protein n=1 Tax=Bauhinia variegata TaxID=167791 RepID=A0ACB9NF58_BAUVA|nr:hypothetical protein L6164_013502 [Bauhinia variegata]